MTLREYDNTEWETLEPLIKFAEEHGLRDCEPMCTVYYPAEDYESEIEDSIKTMLEYDRWYEIRDYLNSLDVEGYDIVIDDSDGPYGVDFGNEDRDTLDYFVDEVRDAAIRYHVFEEEEEEVTIDGVDNDEWDPMKGYQVPSVDMYTLYANKNDEATKESKRDGTDFSELMSLVKSELEFQALQTDTQTVSNLYNGE